MKDICSKPILIHSFNYLKPYAFQSSCDGFNLRYNNTRVGGSYGADVLRFRGVFIVARGGLKQCRVRAACNRGVRVDERMDQWTNGPTDQWTDGPMDQWTDGPMDRWTKCRVKKAAAYVPFGEGWGGGGGGWLGAINQWTT